MKNTVSEYGMSQLSEFVASKLGLHFPPERWGDLEQNIATAAREFQYTDIEAFIQWLVSAEINTAEMEILASSLTVNETYFWREPEIFDALIEKILPEIIESKRGYEKRLRIWSAGCSTGEEPYSIAIALLRAIPAIKEWNISILATDINPRILKKAATGEYGEWSFRNTPSWLKQKHFSRKSDGRYVINSDIRKKVVFSYLNLAEDIYPTPMNNTNAMDIVFCRNVLMYFVPSRGRTAAEHLYRSLVKDGYLIVSACELSEIQFPQFNPVYFPGAVVYKKGVPHLKSALPLQIVISEESFQEREMLTEMVPPLIMPEENRMDQPAEPLPAGEETPELSLSLSIRALANEGKLPEALDLCEKAIQKEKLDPMLHFLRAAILQEQNREEEAIESLHRALYIDQNLVLAHFSLGNLMLRRGNISNTKKYFRNALSLLDMLKQDDILPESDGLTAGRFREIINATLQAGVPV